jgi:hypothetical protein
LERKKGVRTPSHSDDPQNASEDRDGDGGSGDSNSVLAESTLVAPPSEVSESRNSLGKSGGDTNTGANDEEARNEVTPGRDDDVEDLLAAIKGKDLRPGVGFVARALQLGQWRPGLVKSWFLQTSKSNTRVRLKAASLFGEWCMRKGISANQVAEQKQPQIWLEECIEWVYENFGSYELANTCKTGISALYRDWFNIPDVGKNGLVVMTLRSKAASRTPMGAKRTIWNIDILITSIRREGAPGGLQELDWDRLVGRIGSMLMIYTACRISDMFNIAPERSRWSEEGGMMMIAMKTKSGEGRLKFGIVIPTEDSRVDPVNTIREYRSRVSRFSSSQSSFFLQKDGSPISSPEKLASRYLVPYIRRAGIPAPYTAYSIKKAVITSLFNKGFSKERISSFTGHSNDCNTALKHYHDPTNDWLGHILAGGASMTREVEVPDDAAQELNGAEEEDE